MITESYYWKRPLLLMAARIQRFDAMEELTEAEFGRLERDFMIGFFSIRKLLEAPAKISQQIRMSPVTLRRFERLASGRLVDWYNRHEFWEHYDLESAEVVQRDLWFVASRVIHTFIFHRRRPIKASPEVFSSTA